MTEEPPHADRLRVVGIADTDSYVKWAAALLGTRTREWDVSLLVLSTPVTVSDAQLTSATAGSGLDESAVRRVTLTELEESLSTHPADAVLLAARGPLVRVIAKTVASIDPRPVIVSGLPGISIPATRKALIYRTQADLFVLHSHREVREFARLAALGGFDPVLALATLPFAAHAQEAGRRHPGGARAGGDLVFAAQAKVPAERADRMRVARILLDAARADPDRRVVLKLRGVKGEHQTHAEADPYPDLLRLLGEVPGNLVTSTEPMTSALDSAEGLVTVSSTAAIEAVARGIPVIALDSFGVSPELINPVFTGSGLFGSAGDVVSRRFRHADATWLSENYLHDPADDDWSARVAQLVANRRAGTLRARRGSAQRGGRLRDAWERKIVLGPMDRSVAGSVAVTVGLPLRAALRVTNRVRRAIGGQPAEVTRDFPTF